MSRSMSSTLLVLALSTLAAAEYYDHRKHAPRWEDHRAPRVSRSDSRKHLQKRQAANATLPQPGQPTYTIPDSLLGGYQQVGSSGVSAQQMFLGTDNLVYILDKVENNPLQINGHAAWATVYDLTANQAQALEVVTNTFCAGGAQLGNGDWLNIGGNQAVDPGGVASNSQTGANTYQDSDGGFACRTITPGVGSNWTDDHSLDLTTRRWYPSLEPMVDGRVFVMGGDFNGGFVNSVNNSNPTYEFWPKYEGESTVESPILEDTLPANLYPITHLLPDGRIMLNIDRDAAVLDISQTPGVEYRLANGVPHAIRTYPASAATALLPLTVENGWNATIIYCGGSDIAKEQWLDDEPLAHIPASASCIKFSPATDSDFEEEDSLPEGRVMGNGILLPDATWLVLNGANTGVAGYAGNAVEQAWSVDDGFADVPCFTPVIYDPKKPAGQRWNRDGLQSSQIARMYHSTATLLPDGSVLVGGSNPHADYSPNKTYATEYRVERFFPHYYNERRPEPVGIPAQITYGGQYFDLSLSKDDLFDNQGNLNNVNVWLMRTGFSTHGINFGMRMVELDHTFTANEDGSATLHVSQAPPNPAVIPPGTSWFFVTVNGVPSVGVQVTVGSGALETQTKLDVEALPISSNVTSAPSNNGQHTTNAALPSIGTSIVLLTLSLIASAITLA